MLSFHLTCMPEEERKYLKEHYEVCRKGRFDYCYAFIEASINALKPDGKMIYLIPFSIFRNRYARELRKYVVDGMQKPPTVGQNGSFLDMNMFM